MPRECTLDNVLFSNNHEVAHGHDSREWNQEVAFFGALKIELLRVGGWVCKNEVNEFTRLRLKDNVAYFPESLAGFGNNGFADKLLRELLVIIANRRGGGAERRSGCHVTTLAIPNI